MNRIRNVSLKPSQNIFSNIDIGWPTALWVLAAHLYALLVPLFLCVAVYRHWDYLVVTTDRPLLFYIAAALMGIASSFEIAQNSIDHWYLTPDTASANGSSFCDFLFYWFATLSQLVMVMAIAGNSPWLAVIAIVVAVIFPVCYYYQFAHFAPMSIAGLLVAVTAYQAFGDPVIFLQFLLVGLTLYCFNALLRTGNQLLHGFTTAFASSGLWLFIWAMQNGANGAMKSWFFVAGTIAITVLVARVAWPFVSQLRASQRKTSIIRV